MPENDIEENTDDSSEEMNYINNQFRSPKGTDKILRLIEVNNPMVIRRLVMHGIPYPVAVNMVRSIIHLTLQYHR